MAERTDSNRGHAPSQSVRAPGTVTTGSAPTTKAHAEAVPDPKMPSDEVNAGPTDASAESRGHTRTEPSVGEAGDNALSIDAPSDNARSTDGHDRTDNVVDGAVTVETTTTAPPASGRFSRFPKAQLLVALLVASLGFAIVVQLRQTEQQGLASLRQSDLVRILDDVGDRRDRLAAEASDLESQRRELTDVRTGDQAALDAARRRATTLGILAGTVPATGPGVEVYITDPGTAVRAATLLDLVQELRDAGAEAIQIGSARVIASTSFSDVDGGVAVDNMMLRPPYTVRAIGDGQTMATALEIPGGVIASIPEGAHATVATRDEVDVTALHALPDNRYARPAVTPTPTPSGS